MEDKIWIFYYNPMVHESSAAAISFHRTKKGAQIALEFHRQGEWSKWDEYLNNLDPEGRKHAGKFGEYERWFVKEEELAK